MKLFNFFKKKNTIDNDSWQFYSTSNEDDIVMLIAFDTTYLEEKTRPKFEFEFEIAFKIPTNFMLNNMVTPNGNNALYKAEDKLISHIESFNIDCKNVARNTHGTKRGFVFEANNETLFRKCFESFKLKENDFEVELSTYNPWDLYKYFLPNEYDWQQINSLKILRLLEENGSNLNKEHFIEHALIGDALKIKELKEKLIIEGYEIINHNEDWLEVGKWSMPDLNEITSQSYFLMDIAKDNGVNYDGWQTAILK
jgi:regulator of RNase E activity RraB